MIHIIGIVGLPSSYGGFETLVDHLLDSQEFRRHGVRVYSESELCDLQGGAYKGAQLYPLRWKANGWQSVLFDSQALVTASLSGGVVLVLGTSATLWLPLLRRLFPNVRYVVNMAGLEWARSKWGGFARRFLKYNEAIAARYAHAFIADNQGLVEYVKTTYGRNATLIAYGGDQFEDALPDAGVFDTFDLPERYDFAMARAQVDNNVELILEAYTVTGLPLVFVSNWESSPFGREMRRRYDCHPNIHLIGPIYDVAKVKALHERVRLYVHGHSAGGTNPVLVEAMWSGLPTLAFDVPFHRYTTAGRAFYFKSVAELVLLSTTLTQYELEACKKGAQKGGVRELSMECHLRSLRKDNFSVGGKLMRNKSFRIILLELLGPIVQLFRLRLLRVKGYRNIDDGVTIERNVNLDRVYPESIYIGEGSLIASSAVILSHEHVYRDRFNPDLPLNSPVFIGKRCFIGVAAVVLPGVRIGDDCLIGAGTLVNKDIPAGSVAVGVPARIVRSGIKMSSKAVLLPQQ